ncbi:fungal-specific transcription factor domain-containing protein [Rhexocercosporidium sp. MPI-PUGE-AT-0058]|nr:fungal-specific transcription factor domain-containing protein [Rhexocercosporidium sp. MPI-PUGE-AT-0058]
MQEPTQRDPSQESSQKKRSYNDSAATENPRRQRREKYTPAACEECKKKKIKCSGDLPCRRCESHDKACKYVRGAAADGEVLPSTSDRCTVLEAQVRGLEAKVQQLQSVIEEIKVQVSKSGLKGSHGQIQNGQPSIENNTSTSSRPQPNRPSTSQTKLDTAPTRPKFHGPTSSAFSFSVANSALSRRGIEIMNPESSRLESEVTSRQISPEQAIQDPASQLESDPLLALGLTEVRRVLDVYEEELHPVYPFIDVDDVRERVGEMYRELEVCCGMDGASEGARTCGDDVMVLKMMVATALVVEGAGKSVTGQMLLGSVDATLDKGMKVFGINIKQLQLYTLTSIYHFHCDEDTLAWRTIGISVRIALEMGLHRKESLLANVPDPEKRHWALRLFYCIYVLDRRWSFGTGLPFAFHDSDIDPELPNLEGKVPYLESMASYGKISSKVWELVAGFNPKSIDAENVNYLDFQVQRWRGSLPPSLQLATPPSTSTSSTSPVPASYKNPPQSLQRLQVLLYLRANHLRILIHRHHILSSSSIASNLSGAHLVTSIAKDTIRLLVLMRETSTIYETQQPSYNYFLISALAAIFLAVCHDPGEFSAGCRDEFFSALELLKVLSGQGSSAKRLWRSLKGLRKVAPRLGLTPREAEMLDVDGDGDDHNHNLSSSSSGRQSTHSRPQNTETAFSYRPLVQTTSGIETVTPAGERAWNVNKAYDAGVNGMMNTEVDFPDMFYMSNELTNMFEAFGDVRGDMGLDFGGGDVSALFGDLL